MYWGTYPSMYDNWFAKLFLQMKDGEELWGPFVFYDVFSWTGLFNLYWDFFFNLVTFIPQLIIAFIRDGNGDWSFWQTWGDDNVDKD